MDVRLQLEILRTGRLDARTARSRRYGWMMFSDTVMGYQSESEQPKKRAPLLRLRLRVVLQAEQVPGKTAELGGDFRVVGQGERHARVERGRNGAVVAGERWWMP